jgi:hypothetical protein
LLGRLNRWRLEADDHVNPAVDKLRCQLGKSFCLALSGANIEQNIFPLRVSCFAQTFPEHAEERIGIGNSSN